MNTITYEDISIRFEKKNAWTCVASIWIYLCMRKFENIYVLVSMYVCMYVCLIMYVVCVCGVYNKRAECVWCMYLYIIIIIMTCG